jgi:hypothetical protein
MPGVGCTGFSGVFCERRGPCSVDLWFPLYTHCPPCGLSAVSVRLQTCVFRQCARSRAARVLSLRGQYGAGSDSLLRVLNIGLHAVPVAARPRRELKADDDLVRSGYGDLKVLVDDNVVIDGGAVAFLAILPSAQKLSLPCITPSARKRGARLRRLTSRSNLVSVPFSEAA